MLISVHRVGSARPRAATIVAARTGRQTLRWTPGLRAAMSAPGEYRLIARTGQRGRGAEAITPAFRVDAPIPSRTPSSVGGSP